MRSMTKGTWQLVVLTCIFCLGGCTKQKTSEQKIVRFNLGDEPSSLDPRIARDALSQMLNRMCFEGLTRIGPSDSPEFALASSIEISDDLKTYTFHLRPCSWSNGERVQASDFIYAWRSQLSPSFPSDNAYQLYVIKNARAIKAGKLPLEALGAQAVEDDCLVVELEYPVPYFLELTAAPFFYPVHEATDRVNPRWAERPQTFVGNGPFQIEHWHHHDQISMRKNPHYWDQEAVEIEGLDLFMVASTTALHLFEQGEIHWTGSPIGGIPVDALVQLKQKEQVLVKPRAATTFIKVNTTVEGLSDPNVRKALALAINREAIVKHVLQGGQLPAQGFIPPSMLISDQPYFEDDDLEQATALFRQASDQVGSLSLGNLTLLYTRSERSHRVAQILQEQWESAFGFRINLERVGRKIYFDRISKGDYQLALGDWIADFHDAANFLEVFKFNTQSTNNTGWENAEYVHLLDSSNQVLDPLKRKKLLKLCEQILMEDMPIIPLYFASMLYMKDPTLEGVVFSTLGNLDFKWARLQQVKSCP